MTYRLRVVPKKKRRGKRRELITKPAQRFQFSDSWMGCPLEEQQVFGNLPRQVHAGIDAIASIAVYPKGAILFVEGETPSGVFVLRSGRVKLSVSSADGKSIIIRRGEPGEVIGLPAAISGKPNELTAEALESLHCNFIPRDPFLRFLRKHGEAALRVAEILSEIYLATLHQVRYLGLSASTAEKLARFLLESPAARSQSNGHMVRGLISYDQFLQYYRSDSSWNDSNFRFQLGNASPVDAGMVYNPTANQPCSNTPTSIFDATTTPPTLKATCNGYQGYSRFAPVRTSYPTEQLTLQSSYFRRLDLSARASYSAADTKIDNLGESFLGLISRTGQRAFDVTGPAKARRVVANVDFGVTVRLTDKFRLTDSFRFSNFRIPGSWDPSTLSFFDGTTPASMLNPVDTFDPTVCPADPAACPQHGNSAPADVASRTNARFLGQDSKYNTIEAEYDFSKHFGGRLGYRYGHRTIPVRWITTTAELFFPTNPDRGDCVGLPLNPDGSCSFSGEIDSEDDKIKVNEHSALFGLWAHPNDTLRINFDMELFSADNSPTRTTPRNLQRFKTRINYKPKQWVNVSGTVNVLESRNNVTDVLHREHDRNYGFTLALDPNPRFSFEFGYNYDDIFSTTNICYVIGGTVPPGSTLCNSGTPFLSGISFYDNKINFGYMNFMFKPAKRVTANLGYNLTSTSGNTTILSPTPNTLGPLGFNFHKPSAWVDFDLTKGLTWRTAWGYYDYNEKSNPGPLPARDFQSNSATLSLRYSF
jgi:CRP-like cAMP-binding protein